MKDPGDEVRKLTPCLDITNFPESYSSEQGGVLEPKGKAWFKLKLHVSFSGSVRHDYRLLFEDIGRVKNFQDMNQDLGNVSELGLTIHGYLVLVFNRICDTFRIIMPGYDGSDL